MMGKTKLLAPAGSMEALKAGIYCGANGVYAGSTAFNARNFATNFTTEVLKEAVDFCHTYDASFYQTLNTLVSDRETDDFLKQVEYANKIGVDGVIVQDIGMMKLIRECFPNLKISGSTQMSVCNLDGVLQAAELGASRVVLARELPLTEIAYICKNSPIEIETFIHGALCMCYSGQCYLSGLIGQRSGNRGQCAQPCRLPYAVSDGEKGYPLSLKDLCGADEVTALAKAGVNWLKIEGRMKRSEYVGVVTSVYERLLRTNEAPTLEEMDKLTTIFSRGGFTKDYLTGATGKQMFGIKTENENTKGYQSLLKETVALCSEKNAKKRVPVTFTCVIAKEKPVLLTGEDDKGNTVSGVGEVPQKAVNKAVGADSVEKQLTKLGGTPYYIDHIQCEIEENLSVPMSALNVLRRDVIEGLTQKRIALKAPIQQERTALTHPTKSVQPPQIVVDLPSARNLCHSLLELSIARVYLPLEEVSESEIIIKKYLKDGLAICPKLPRIYFDKEREEVVTLLKKWGSLGVCQVLCANIGQIGMVKKLGFTPRGDFSLNCYNSTSNYEFGQMGLKSITASFEMRTIQIEQMGKYEETECIVYGKVPVMITENCVIEGSYKNCKKCEQKQYLTDRIGESFLVKKAFGCRNELFHSQPIYLADKLEDFKGIGLAALRLIFTDEPLKEMIDVIQAYQNGFDVRPIKFTRGLYYKGVK